MCQAVLIDRGLDLLLFVPHLASSLFGFLGASKTQILSDRFSIAFFVFWCFDLKITLLLFGSMCDIIFAG